MIIENGVIHIKLKAHGGLVDGNPIKPSENWSKPIPCFISAVKHNNRGVSNGNTFTEASYEVSVNDQPFEADTIKLVLKGKEIGNFSIQSIEHLDVVCVIKITV